VRSLRSLSGGESLPSGLCRQLVGVTALPDRGTIWRLAVGSAIALVLATGFSACSSNGNALAIQACSHINQSIVLLNKSEHQSQQVEAARLRQQAYIELREALPIAAQAAIRDGQWQALMTTVAESNRVPEETLTNALSAQCKMADSPTFDQTPPPSSIPPSGPISSSP
jgi:hypothetical protein